jgi:glycerophosphoryl diester phosphodiesterase
VNDQELAKELFSFGVSAVFTDDPLLISNIFTTLSQKTGT